MSGPCGTFLTEKHVLAKPQRDQTLIAGTIIWELVAPEGPDNDNMNGRMNNSAL
jgi:hypothetical protein